jgi:hypothetical protein
MVTTGKRGDLDADEDGQAAKAKAEIAVGRTWKGTLRGGTDVPLLMSVGWGRECSRHRGLRPFAYRRKGGDRYCN